MNIKTTNQKYNRDYFENGIVTEKSCYSNYRWMPELTIKMAYNLIKYLKLKENETILDFGCAKGFLVKALRILDIPAYGCDISSYAIDNIDIEVRPYCKLIKTNNNIIPFNFNFDWIITKDVLEHLEEKDVDKLLAESRKKTTRMFHVIPLGNYNNQYIIPEYKLDKSHILVKPASWWIEKFKSSGWINTTFAYKVKGIKDNWTKKYKHGNGFFVLNKDT